MKLVSAVDKNVRSFLPSVLLTAWAVVLLIAFLANRSADVGDLGRLARLASTGAWIGAEGVVASFVGVLSAVFIVVSWFGLGSFITSFIDKQSSEGRSLFFENTISTAAGAATWSLIFFVLGLVGGYSAAAAVAAMVVGVALAAMAIRRQRAASRTRDRSANHLGFERVLIVLTGIPVFLAFILALAPPIAKDTLLYHFSVPKLFVANGGLLFVPGNIASYMSLSTEMHVVWAMLLGGLWSPRAAEAASGAVIWMFLPLLLLTIYAWSRELKVGKRSSLLAVLLVAAIPTIYYVAGNGYVDVASTLFVTLAVYAFGRWWKTQNRASVIYVGLFLGAALSAKLITLYVFAALMLLIFWRAKTAKADGLAVGKLILSGLAALVLAAALAAPWYSRTWIATGSPIFPFYTSVWSGTAPGWDAERSSLIQQKDAQYGGISKSALDYVLAPFYLSVNSQPDLPRNFDGVLGAGFLFGISVLGFALWKFDLPVEPKIAVGVAGILFVFWLFSSQQLRYLLPIFPALAVAIVLAAEAARETAGNFYRITRGAIVVLSIAGVLVSTAWFLQIAPLRVVLGGESRDLYLTRNLDYYHYYQLLNDETPKDARVWLINMRRDSYNLNAGTVGDYLFEDWTLKKLVWESADLADLKAKARLLGVQYMLTRHDFMFDIERSTLVDEKRTRVENDAKLRLAKEFVLDRANVIRSDEKFSLVKVL